MPSSPPRVACVVVPLFPLAARLRSEPELAGEAVAVFEGNGNAARVMAATRPARRAGVQPGQTLPQARALLPDLLARGRDFESERAAQEALAEAADGFSPRVETAGEGVVYFDAVGIPMPLPSSGHPEPSEGSAELRLGRAVIAAVEKAGLPARFGIAASKLAARVAAGLPDSPTVVPEGEEARFLAPLPLAKLAPEMELAETLEMWGIRSIGELAKLPEGEVASRLGPLGRELPATRRGRRRVHVRRAARSAAAGAALALRSRRALSRPARDHDRAPGRAPGRRVRRIAARRGRPPPRAFRGRRLLASCASVGSPSTADRPGPPRDPRAAAAGRAGGDRHRRSSRVLRLRSGQAPRGICSPPRLRPVHERSRARDRRPGARGRRPLESRRRVVVCGSRIARLLGRRARRWRALPDLPRSGEQQMVCGWHLRLGPVSGSGGRWRDRLSPSRKESAMTQKSVAELAKEQVIAYNEKDWDRARAAFAPEIVYEEVGTHRKVKGVDDVLTTWKGWAKAIPDSRATFQSEIVSGNTAVLEITWSGTHNGPLNTGDREIPPTGK